MCFVWISEQTAIISLYSINWLVFITETGCVYCAVRAGTYAKQIAFCPEGVSIFCLNTQTGEPGLGPAKHPFAKLTYRAIVLCTPPPGFFPPIFTEYLLLITDYFRFSWQRYFRAVRRVGVCLRRRTALFSELSLRNEALYNSRLQGCR
jgi:hypothetical protein